MLIKFNVIIRIEATEGEKQMGQEAEGESITAEINACNFVKKILQA